MNTMRAILKPGNENRITRKRQRGFAAVQPNLATGWVYDPPAITIACMTDLKYYPDSFAGPVDERVVKSLSERWALDPTYLAHQREHHGGVPTVALFDTASGTHRLGRFLTLLDRQSKTPGPHRPHFEFPDMDERMMRSVDQLSDGEHATSRALFDHLLPFAVLGKDADAMCLDRAYVDLLCFDYRASKDQPSVVRWCSHEANSAYMDWEEAVDALPDDEQDEEYESMSRVPWAVFLEPVASDFASFLALLRAE